MTAPRTRYLHFSVSIVVLGFACYWFAPRDAVHGIKIDGTLYDFQSAAENYRYRYLVDDVISGNATALPELTKIDCGGGAGCYDHGAVLARILMKVGDGKFPLMAARLDQESKSMLGSLLLAGFEYGFPKEVDPGPLYPMTMEVLSIAPRWPGYDPLLERSNIR